MPRKPAETKYKICDTCDKQFNNLRVSKNGVKYRIKGKKWQSERFCGRQCIPRAPRLSKFCVACGLEYFNLMPSGHHVKAEKWEKSQWCSKPCRWKTQGALRLEKFCAACGKAFTNQVRWGVKAGSYVNSKRFQTQTTCSTSCSLKYRQRRTVKEAFLRNVGEPEPSGCILWRGHITKSGHGRIELKEVQDRGVLAHRLSFALFNGPVPHDRIVCHACHTAQCVNPEHLYLGDYLTNANDRYKRDRPPVAGMTERFPAISIDDDGVLTVTDPPS